MLSVLIFDMILRTSQTTEIQSDLKNKKHFSPSTNPFWNKQIWLKPFFGLKSERTMCQKLPSSHSQTNGSSGCKPATALTRLIRSIRHTAHLTRWFVLKQLFFVEFRSLVCQFSFFVCEQSDSIVCFSSANCLLVGLCLLKSSGGLLLLCLHCQCISGSCLTTHKREKNPLHRNLFRSSSWRAFVHGQAATA